MSTNSELIAGQLMSALEVQRIWGSIVTNVRDYGALGNGILNDTYAIKRAASDLNRSGGGTLLFPYGTYNVSETIDIPENITVDLQYSTINWVGEKFNNLNKDQRWRNCIFHLGGEDRDYVNVVVKNGFFNVNDWGAAIAVTRLIGVFLSGLTIRDSQFSGFYIIDSLNGEISRCNLIDCAANPSSGFEEPTDLETWSDGLYIGWGSQNWTVSSTSIVNTRVATGRCGIVVEFDSEDTGRQTRNIKFQDVTAIGYDRQIHIERCGKVSVNNCHLEFVPSGEKRMKATAVCWTSTDVYFDNTRFISTNRVLEIIDSKNIGYRACKMVSTSTVSTAFFRNSDSLENKNISFTDCVMDMSGGSIELGGWYDKFTNVTHINCEFYGIMGQNIEFSTFKGSFNRCRFFNLCIKTSSFTDSGNEYKFDRCEFYQEDGTNYSFSCDPGTGTIVLDENKVEGKVYIDSPYVQRQTPMLSIENFVGTVPNNYGLYYGSAAPTSGTYKLGDRVINTSPSSVGYVGWVCVTAGSPGTWKGYGTIQS